MSSNEKKHNYNGRTYQVQSIFSAQAPLLNNLMLAAIYYMFTASRTVHHHLKGEGKGTVRHNFFMAEYNRPLSSGIIKSDGWALVMGEIGTWKLFMVRMGVLKNY